MLIDQSNAFTHGFIKGIGAPAMLFGLFDVPKHNVEYLSIPNIAPESALAADWLRIGVDVQAAKKKIEKENE